MRQPIIALVIATFNSEKTLGQCLDSIIQQTYPHKKILIIDGKSTDNTLKIIRQYERHIDFWVSEKDNGVYDAWNKALFNMPLDVDWIQFLGSDDYLFDPTVLERIACNLTQVPDDCLLAHTKVMVKYPSGAQEIVGRAFDRELFFKTGNMVDAATIQIGFFHHRKLFERYGFFNDSFKICADLDFFFRCLKTEDSLFIEDVIAAVHVLGGLSSSAALAYKSFCEKEAIFEGHGFFVQHDMPYYLRKTSCFIKQWMYENLGEAATVKLIDIVRKLSGSKPLKTKDPSLISKH